MKAILKFVPALFLLPGLIFPGCTKSKSPLEHEGPDVPGKYRVYIRNYGDEMWIGTNLDSMGAAMKKLVTAEGAAWIGGQVIPDSSYPYGFYFDPNTVLVAEFTAEGMQTTIAQIARDPAYFATHGWPTQYAEHAWYVWGTFLEYRAK